MKRVYRLQEEVVNRRFFRAKWFGKYISSGRFENMKKDQYISGNEFGIRNVKKTVINCELGEQKSLY